jgi:hypothetical protein
MEDQREKVIEAIRTTLPEFAERNGIELSEKVMDNLAHWTAGVIPWLVYRRPCPANLEGLACACPGFCSAWRSLSVEAWTASEDADPIERETTSVGGAWTGTGKADDFTILSP